MDTKSPEFLPVLLMANFNQNIDFEDIENDRFENMVDIVNMSQMLNVQEVHCDDDRDGEIISSNWTLPSFKQ